jgi:MSHA biogenesis protein MshO
MRRIRPESDPRAARGLTLIELVVAMVLVAIIVGSTVYFVYPLRQAVDLTTRAELTDIADNSLQRIGRDVRLSLPNSVRVSASGSSKFLEFLAVRAAGRYRADSGSVTSGTDCPLDGMTSPPATAGDQLSFDVGDTCFKSIGTVANAANITTADFLVLNNYGPAFAGQNAYEAGAANRVLIAGRTVEAARVRINFASTTFQRMLHDSPGRRFYVISGPVTYECDTATRKLWRHAGYAISPAAPTTSGLGNLIADNVTDCTMDYDSNGVAPQVGLLTLRLTLSKTLSGGTTESVSLYHAVHVTNVP